MPSNPSISTSPRCSRDLTTTASCPVASTTILDSNATGSTHVIALGSADTGVQFITTPPTLSFLTTTSSNLVMLRTLTPASIAAPMSLEHACGPSAT